MILLENNETLLGNSDLYLLPMHQLTMQINISFTTRISVLLIDAFQPSKDFGHFGFNVLAIRQF